MARLLRLARRAKWINPTDFVAHGNGDMTADVFEDFKTINCALSVWVVDDSNIRRVVAALCATRDSIGNADYVVFDSELTTRAGADLVISNGMTPDDESNQQWHRDLCGMSVLRLSQLVVSLSVKSIAPSRFTSKEVKGLLSESIRAGHIDLSKVNSKLREDIER